MVPPGHAVPHRAHEKLRQHRELILNYFRAQKLLSSGVVEGLNNKAKVTMRRSYGFRTYRVLELALYHSLGNQKAYRNVNTIRRLPPSVPHWFKKFADESVASGMP